MKMEEKKNAESKTQKSNSYLGWISILGVGLALGTLWRSMTNGRTHQLKVAKHIVARSKGYGIKTDRAG